MPLRVTLEGGRWLFLVLTASLPRFFYLTWLLLPLSALPVAFNTFWHLETVDDCWASQAAAGFLQWPIVWYVRVCIVLWNYSLHGSPVDSLFCITRHDGRLVSDRPLDRQPKHQRNWKRCPVANWCGSFLFYTHTHIVLIGFIFSAVLFFSFVFSWLRFSIFTTATHWQTITPRLHGWLMALF